MIIAEIRGGLGNQMFQYAAGRALADRHKTGLLLYAPRTNDVEKHRDYMLNYFPVRASAMRSYPLIKHRRFKNSLCRFHLGRVCHAIWLAGKKISGTAYVKEKSLSSPDAFARIKDNSFLRGYWQNPFYFQEIAADLAHDFMVTTEPDNANRKMLEKISACESVAVHVRRTDYLKSPSHLLHGIDYYQAAFQRILESCPSAVFFVFSDDMVWTKQHIQPPGKIHHVDINGLEHGWKDMRLMRACRHFIIANSSFSWWPAWLKGSRDSIVAAPEEWYSLESAHKKHDLSKHCPDHWIRL